MGVRTGSRRGAVVRSRAPVRRRRASPRRGAGETRIGRRDASRSARGRRCDLVPVSPTPPQELRAAHMERGRDQDAHPPSHDLVERPQQRLGLPGDERVDQDGVLAVTQRVRRHRRRDAVPLDGKPPESGGGLVERGHAPVSRRLPGSQVQASRWARSSSRGSAPGAWVGVLPVTAVKRGRGRSSAFCPASSVAPAKAEASLRAAADERIRAGRQEGIGDETDVALRRCRSVEEVGQRPNDRNGTPSPCRCGGTSTQV